jgi:hypothetical protein
LVIASGVVPPWMASLMSARTGEAMLVARTEAVLSQARATDMWNEYEADSLKAHINESLGLAESSLLTKQRLASLAKEYRERQPPLRAKALDGERQRDEDLMRSDRFESRKQLFDLAVALFEIAIVLTSVAAMVKQPGLFVLAAIMALGAVGFDAWGFLR